MPHPLDRPIGAIPPQLVDIYDETSFWSARFGALLLDHLDIRGGIAGLDLGCGTGFPLIELAHLHGPCSRFTGVDIWREALDRARLKAGLHRLENVALVAADVAALPFAGASFDLVVANLGLNNFADPSAALRECRRVTRPGARIVLTTNVQGHFGAVYALLDDILRELGLEAARDALRREAAHRPSLDVIAHLLEGSGFAVSRSFENRFWMRFADGSALLRHSLVSWFLDGWRRAVGDAHEREVLGRLEQRLDAVARRDGSVTMAVPMLYIEGVAG